METYDVITRIIGNTYPTGDEAIDSRRLENLKDMIEVARNLINDINNIYTYNKDSLYSSRRRSAFYAAEFLKGYNLINEEE